MSADKSRVVAAAAAGSAQKSLAWIQRNPEKVRAERASLEKDFRKFALAARKCEVALERPMCVGVFGPSQAGKSYLISALARKGTSRLMADFSGQMVDFVADLNPEGGRESTGLVTRFTLKRPKTPAGFPVALRLLTQSDIVKILGNTYFADCLQADEVHPDVAMIKKRVDELLPLAQKQPVDGLAEEDIWDLQEYFERYFKGEVGVRALGQNYWPTVAELAPRLAIADRARLFALIWNDIDHFTQLYIRLANALRDLGFAQNAYCAMDALVPRERSIIDVATLKGLAKTGGETLQILGDTGARARIARADMTALTAELNITVAEKPWPFFDQTDLLDFPGARSRKRIRQVRDFLKESENLSELYLRGKVAYLFERYCAEQELTAMLLCIGPSNQEVLTLPEMVREWIDTTHGPTPEERAKQQTALFFILTKFDAEFEEKAGQADTSSHRWTARLNASLLDFFGKTDEWPRHWVPGRPFNNTFWLRNPNFVAKHIIDYDDQQRELRLRPSEVERIKRNRQEYLDNELVQRHFHDPARCWDEALKLNDGGVAYLAERLAPACNPDLKRNQIDGRVAHLKKQMAERLKRYFISGDINERLDEARGRARNVAQHLIQTIQAQRFGLLLSQLQVEFNEISDVFFRIETQPAPARGGPSSGIMVGRGVDPMALFRDVFGDETPSAALADVTDQNDRFAEAAIDTWTLKMRGVAEQPYLHNFFFLPEEPFGWFVSDLILAAQRLSLKKRIADEVRRVRAFHQRMDLGAARPVMAAVGAINELVNGLGYLHVPLPQRPLVGKGTTARPVFAPRAEFSGTPKLGVLPAQYDQVYYGDWLVAFRRLCEENVTVLDGKTVDAEANADLGRILNALAA